MVGTDGGIKAVTVQQPARMGEFVSVADPLRVLYWARTCRNVRRLFYRGVVLRQLWLILALVHILDQELDDLRLIVGKIDNIVLGFLGRQSDFTSLSSCRTRTCPPNLSARAKKLTRSHTTILCTLYVSLPQVMLRSEYAPDWR